MDSTNKNNRKSLLNLCTGKHQHRLPMEIWQSLSRMISSNQTSRRYKWHFHRLRGQNKAASKCPSQSSFSTTLCSLLLTLWNVIFPKCPCFKQWRAEWFLSQNSLGCFPRLQSEAVKVKLSLRIRLAHLWRSHSSCHCPGIEEMFSFSSGHDLK